MPTLPDILDEQAGRLLKAIEYALVECEHGDSYAASITLAMALEEHKARLVEHAKPTLCWCGIPVSDHHFEPIASLWEDKSENAKGNEMKDKTPVWVHKVKADLALHETEAVETIIMRHAPDAEALAVAMESIDKELREYVDAEMQCDHTVGLCACSYHSIREHMAIALAAYRARFPKE